MDLNNKNILIIKPSSLGDIIHTLPVVHALKRLHPTVRIGWMVQEHFAGLLAQDVAVEQVYPIAIPSTSDPRAGRFAYLQAFTATVHTLGNLRKVFRSEPPCDLILDLHASFRSGVLGLTAGKGVRIGFQDARELNPLFQDERIAVPADVVHAVDKNLLFLEHLHCTVAREDFYLCCDDLEKERIGAFLTRQGLADQTLVYANPAARWQTKFWPVENWAGLADTLHRQGIRMIFAGSPADRPYIATIGEKMASPLVNAAGRLSLVEAVALLHRSSLYVGLDSGPMHMAAMAGIPVVALFGPTHPERVGPYGVEHRILQAADLDCLGCRKRQCPELRCMRGITVSAVMEAVDALLLKGQ